VFPSAFASGNKTSLFPLGLVIKWLLTLRLAMNGVNGYGTKGMMRISVNVPLENTREMFITEQFVIDIAVFLVMCAVEVIQ